MTAEAPVEVLLVDDSAVIRGMIARGLQSDPAIRVIGSASDGQNALAMLDALSPQVIVLDVEMPVMNGLEALPKILAKRPGVTVIMASALTRR
ncbi:MAG: response regulator, partial [Terricaulis sp.]